MLKHCNLDLIYDLRSLFKIRARDWSKSITCVLVIPGNNESFECVITITHEKCAVLKMARSKTSRKLYLQVDKANKLKKISMNSTIKTKKENILENFYRQRQLNLVNTDYSHFFVCELSHESSFNRLFLDVSLCLFA